MPIMPRARTVMLGTRTVNTCRGIVRDRAKCLSDMTEVDIAAELKSQGVTSVKRFTRKDGDTIVKTSTYLLTFCLSTVPKSIKAGHMTRIQGSVDRG